MCKKLIRYELSEEADIDIDEIFDYTERQHGFNLAVKYLSDLDTLFKNLIINPEIGRKRNEIRTELYSISGQEHVIFYRILNDHIRIVRVLHGSKDMPRHFK